MVGYPEDIQGKSYNLLRIEDGRFDEYEDDVDIPTETTNVARSEKFFMPKNSTFSWEVQFESDGAIDVKVELEQQFEEGDDFVVPDNKADYEMFEEVTDSDTHQEAYRPNATLWGRLKLTGLGSNDASTTLVKAKMYVASNYG
jgi:hypothetical protein